MQDLQPYFDRFVDNISLGEPQVSRMDRAARGVMEFLRASYGLSASQVFLQGSYPNGTAVEPVDGGEYDVDIVAVCVEDGTSPNAALSDLQRRFEGNGNYAHRVVPKTPCIRLDYAEDSVGRFHLDVVPVKPNTDWSSTAPLDAPRRGHEWRATAPHEYTQWCTARGDRFARTVKVMKRWRDEQQTVRAAVRSIVLQVLVSECMPDNLGDDQQRLAETFTRMHERLAGADEPPIVRNPVLLSEDLADRWTISSFKSFVGELEEAASVSRRALSAVEPLEAIDCWRELLGEDFPAMSDEQLGLKVADHSHAETFAERGWRVAFDPRYRVQITAGITRGRQRKVRSIPEGQLIFAGNKIRFTANVTAPNHVEVWWQVANTGGHARNADALRGQLFKARLLSGKASPEQHVTWENTAYTGVHLIRAVLVRDSAVVAHSDWRLVNVYARNHPFKL